MKKTMSFVMILCLLHVLAGLGVVGYLFSTGRMDGSKVRVIAKLVSFKGTPEDLPKRVEEILQPVAATTTAPATQKGALATLDNAVGAGASAEERIAFARAAMEQERLQLERQAQEVQHRQKMLDDSLTELKTQREKFDAEKKAFEPKVTGADEKLKAENFQKMLALYDELKPRQVKDLFAGEAKEELAAAYLAAMEPSRAAKVIAEFKTQPEKDFLKRVLERMRTAGTASALGQGAGGDVAALAPKP